MKKITSVFAAVFSFSLASMAFADDFNIKNVATSRMLDSNSDKKVYTLPPNGGTFQKWKMTTLSDGYVVLKNVATGFVLDCNASGKCYTNPRYNDDSFQEWYREKVEGSNNYRLKNKATSLVLDSNAEGQVYALGNNGGSFQKWHFIKRDVNQISE